MSHSAQPRKQKRTSCDDDNDDDDGDRCVARARHCYHCRFGCRFRGREAVARGRAGCGASRGFNSSSRTGVGFELELLQARQWHAREARQMRG
jgi:hypothetical protein